MTRVTSITMTCPAMPAQWEGKTDDDRQVYVRYRFGYLSVRVGEPGDDSEFAGVRGEEIFGADIGGHLDGDMSFGELVHATAGVVSFPASDE